MLFGISLKVFSLNTCKSTFAKKIRSGQQIRLYKANAEIVTYDSQLIRRLFSQSLIFIDHNKYNTPNTDILFLVRRELGGRPIRWNNQLRFESVLNKAQN